MKGSLGPPTSTRADPGVSGLRAPLEVVGNRGRHATRNPSLTSRIVATGKPLDELRTCSDSAASWRREVRAVNWAARLNLNEHCSLHGR